jgi:hypothetical protein
MLELRILLGEYGVDSSEQSVLEVIAGRRAGRGWWDEYADVLPAGMGDFLALETAGQPTRPGRSGPAGTLPAFSKECPKSLGELGYKLRSILGAYGTCQVK